MEEKEKGWGEWAIKYKNRISSSLNPMRERETLTQVANNVGLEL